MEKIKKTEYLIIGAGIVGCCVSYFLSLHDKQVILLDSADACSEASGVNAGTLELLMVPPQLLPLAKEGVELWNRFQNEDKLDVGYKRTGGFFVILERKDISLLKDQQNAFKKCNLKIESLGKYEITKRAPFFSKSVIQANFSPIDGFADPLIAGKQILEAACQRGTEFMPHQHAYSIEPLQKNKGYEVRTSSSIFHASKVLICAGIRSPKLLEPLGVNLKLQTRVNQVTVTEKAPQFITYPFNSPKLSLKQSTEGSVLIGGGWQGYGNLDQNCKNLCIANLCDNIEHAQKIVPMLSNLNILRSWSGFEGYSKERLPFIQEIPNYKGVFAAVTGYVGFTVGPAVASHVTEMML